MFLSTFPYTYPQDVEWAYDKEELFILQSRNIRGKDRASSRRESEK
ncbi:MAG: hypothetical protein JW821_07965 [Deltaproteobacteria bacterium]|nr:hypothetical protein [Deltaproteobacteria bacterium]